MAKNTVLYGRCSTTKQELENQLVQLREFAKKQGWEITNEYTETISGASNERPAFNQLFQDAHKRRFDLVLFWDLSRFSRSGTLFTLQKLKELENVGVGWHSFQEPYVSTAGQWKDVVLSIFATVARMEREKCSERTKAALNRLKLRGVKLGRPKGALDKKRRKRSCFRRSKTSPLFT